MAQLPSNADLMKARQQYETVIYDNRKRLQELETERAACIATIGMANDIIETFNLLYGKP